jgi:glucosylceramidase
MRILILFVVAFVFAFVFSARSAAEQTGKVWVSSMDLKEKFSEKTFAVTSKKAGKHKPAKIEINPEKTFQSIVGIGSSLEHSTCYNLTKLPVDQREKAIADLVDPIQGIGMNLMRICIGTSDFTGDPWYSYDDMPAGEKDPDIERFSIEKDRAYVLPILKTALKRNPELLFLASPWSPPGWMKDSGQMCGGKLLPEHYGAYAEYIIKFIRAYEAEGIPIYAVTLQNEPGVNVKTYPSCFWNGEMQRDFIRDHFGPALASSGLKTLVWCFDHNFNNTAFPRAVFSDPAAAAYVDGAAFHAYEGKVGAMGAFAAEFPSKHMYFTEGSIYRLGGASQIISFFANNARSYNAWVTVIDRKGKPNNGPHGCSPTCIVYDNATGGLDYRFDYYMYGHFSKFIQRGAVRVDASCSDAKLPFIVFRNPDGKFVMVAVNSGGGEREVAVECGKGRFAATITPLSVATFVW